MTERRVPSGGETLSLPATTEGDPIAIAFNNLVDFRARVKAGDARKVILLELQRRRFEQGNVVRSHELLEVIDHGLELHKDWRKKNASDALEFAQTLCGIAGPVLCKLQTLAWRSPKDVASMQFAVRLGEMAARCATFLARPSATPRGEDT